MVPHRIAVIFHRFGPYHRARLIAAASSLEVHAVELSQQTDVYAWDRIELPNSLYYVCVSESVDSRLLRWRQLWALVEASLTSIKPEVVAVNGWADNGALAALSWCHRNRVPAVLMSESNQFDEPRRAIQEWVKRRIVQGFSSALVGGGAAKEYVVDLGMAAESVFLGYDVVDNNHFDCSRVAARTVPCSLPCKKGRYFLASSRFVEKKNLPRLIHAFARHLEYLDGLGRETAESWDLVVLGDGLMREDLIAIARRLKLIERVHFEGFRQYDDLPRYYCNAGAFIHASTTEQWGLVVNEAMASGLPVLVSNRCGCAFDLVEEGVNGFTFDPTDVDKMALLMCKVSDPGFPLAEFGKASRRIISDWGPVRFANGLLSAVEKAIEIGPKKDGTVNKLLLELLCRR